jgi:hypothetical protein
MSKFSEQQVEKPSHERPASPVEPRRGGTVAARAPTVNAGAGDAAGDAPRQRPTAADDGSVAAPTGSPEANADRKSAEKP